MTSKATIVVAGPVSEPGPLPTSVGYRLAMPSHDVVVLGTGAAGLVAALAAHDAGATVGLYEKADVVGGTTALSGGIVWVPNNRQAAAAGSATAEPTH